MQTRTIATVFATKILRHRSDAKESNQGFYVKSEIVQNIADQGDNDKKVVSTTQN